MSREQGPVGGDVAFNPTDDVVPPGAGASQDPDSPQDRSEYDGAEDVGPQDYGAEDVTSHGYGSEDEPADSAGVPGGEDRRGLNAR
jgi:hypothetical protein